MRGRVILAVSILYESLVLSIKGSARLLRASLMQLMSSRKLPEAAK